MRYPSRGHSPSGGARPTAGPPDLHREARRDRGRVKGRGGEGRGGEGRGGEGRGGEGRGGEGRGGEGERKESHRC